MKYLLVLGVVLFAIWLWRHNREREAREAAAARQQRPSPPTADPVPTVTDMVACSHCGLHLPRHEALAGHTGLYCSAAHHLAQEG